MTRDQQPVRAVQVGEGRPDGDPQESDRAENAAEREPGGDLAADDPPPVRSVTSPSASARITSVDACEPELPPLEMISGTNSASTTALRDLLLEKAHRRGGQHLAQEQRR